MQVLKISPRGYCHGVVSSLNLVVQVAHDTQTPRPIYILGQIVHNHHLSKALESLGVITLDDSNKNRLQLLDTIDQGTIIFTAHGVSPEVKAKALAKGLNTIDATCIDVTKTHDFIREFVADGYEIIYIGKKNHPEPEGAIGIAPGFVHLIETAADLESLVLTTDKIMITNQTTMSLWDVSKLATHIQTKFPTAQFHREICTATQVRQEAVAAQAKQADLVIVVGDPKSNNSNRLAQVAIELADKPAYRIANIADLDIQWLLEPNVEIVAVTSGASTPTLITREVIAYLEQFEKDDETTWPITHRVDLVKLLPKIKRKQNS
ncbi:MAG: 4-hydroxy-3-methylbut-2-enyl diphosphate reductase [Culicoidibacterales bacterium]